MQLPSLNAIAVTTSETIRRFPLVLLSALIGAGLCWVLIDDFHYVEAGSIFAAVLGLPLFLGIDLWSERTGQRSLRIVLSLLGVGILITYAILAGDNVERNIVEGYRFALFVLVTHLFVAVAPFLRGGSLKGFWEFNKTLFLRFLLSALFSLVLFGGLAVAFLAVDQLLLGKDVIKPQAYGKLFVMIAALFNTVFFLAGIPQDFASLEGEREYPKGLKIFAQNLLLPLVVLYMSILYIYSVSILINWEWPEGWIGWLVLSFSVLGILALLLLYPLQDRQESNWLIRFSRWFYLAVLPLIALLFAAIIRRVAEYGITENRYFVILLACWLAGTALYFTLSRRKNIKVIPISLGAVALLSAFGPWSAFAVSTASQAGRFDELARTNNLLVEGKIDSAKGKWLDDEPKREMNSILNYLEERDALDKVAYLIPNGIQAGEEVWTLNTRIGIGAGTMGMAKAGQLSFHFAVPSTPFEQQGVDIAGFDLLMFQGNYSYVGVNQGEEKGYNSVCKGTHQGHEYELLFRPLNPEFILVEKGDTILRFRTDSVLTGELAAWSAKYPNYPESSELVHRDHIDSPAELGPVWHSFVIDAAGDSLKGRVIVQSASGYYSRDKAGKIAPAEISVSQMSFLLLLGK